MEALILLQLKANRAILAKSLMSSREQDRKRKRMKLFWPHLSKAGLIAIATLAIISVAALSSASAKDQDGLKADGTLLGNYLAGRFARGQRDTRVAVRFYQNALQKDPANKIILEQAFLLAATAGDWSRAEELAEQVILREPSHRIARLFLGIKAVRSGDYDKAHLQFTSAGKGPIAELTITLLRAWTYAAGNKTEDALKLLKPTGQAQWTKFYKKYHRALIADLGSNTKTALKEYRGIFKNDPKTLRVALAYARHAASSRKSKLAKRVLAQHLSQARPHPEAKALLDLLNSGKTPGLLVANAEHGLAEVFFGLGDALTSEGGIDIGTIYLQFALLLKPDFPLAYASLANVHEQNKKYQLAIETYDRIPEASPIWRRVQIRKAFDLNSMDKDDEARTLLVGLLENHPQEIQILDALGSILRARKNYKEAVEFYSRAIALLKKPEKRDWSYYYARGVCYERLNLWDNAETDLEKALELDPDQPLALNYLGYTWVDQNRRLKRAMAFIRKAVKLKPEDGYFVDSLGWAHYRLGQHSLAVKHLEKATELRPDDPTINDHLGDAYWRAGRILEANFQWKQALTLMPEPADAETIAKKLKDGLPDKRQVKEAAANDNNTNKRKK